tara:strand:+ start:28 stop:459 length:432 start_codon:yes stop_codon:yes gene_type:complete
MTLIKWKPRNNVLMEDVMNFFSNENWNYASSTDYEWSPAIDIEESKNKYNIKMDLPGLSKKDINIHISDNYMNVSGKRENTDKSKNTFYNYQEREFGSFKRKFNIKDFIDQEKIIANFKNGLLDITLPKSKNEIKTKKEIKIN